MNPHQYWKLPVFFPKSIVYVIAGCNAASEKFNENVREANEKIPDRIHIWNIRKFITVNQNTISDTLWLLTQILSTILKRRLLITT